MLHRPKPSNQQCLTLTTWRFLEGITGYFLDSKAYCVYCLPVLTLSTQSHQKTEQVEQHIINPILTLDEVTLWASFLFHRMIEAFIRPSRKRQKYILHRFTHLSSDILRGSQKFEKKNIPLCFEAEDFFSNFCCLLTISRNFMFSIIINQCKVF